MHHGVEMFDVFQRLFVVSVAFDEVDGRDHAFAYRRRSRREHRRVLFHDVHIVETGFAGLGVADVFKVAAGVLLAVHIIGLISLCREPFQGVIHHAFGFLVLCAPIASDSESRPFFEIEGMHRDVCGRELRRPVHGIAEIRLALPREHRDEVHVDVEPFFCKRVGALHVRRRMPSAYAFQSAVVESLWIDGHSGHSPFLEEGERVLGDGVRSARLHGELLCATAFRRREHLVQHGERESGRSASAHIHRSYGIPLFLRGALQIFYLLHQIVRIRAQELLLPVNGHGHEGTIRTARGTERDEYEKIRHPLRVGIAHPFLRREYALHQRRLLGTDREIPQEDIVRVLPQLGVKFGGTYARETAVGKFRPREEYEDAVRRQAALAEQARLKEQEARELDNKVKSIKGKSITDDNKK